MPQKPASRRQIVLTIIGLIALSVVPLCVAWWYYLTLDSRNLETKNLGQFTENNIHINELSLNTLSNITPDNLNENKWWLVYLQEKNCDSHCDDLLLRLRNVHIALGKESYRLKRLIITESEPSKVQADILAADKGLEWELGNYNYIFDKLSPNIKELQNNPVILVDPLGNIVFYYPEAENERLILRDLQHIMKLSRIG